MRKSGRVRLSDLRRVHRLVHNCRDVGHDARAWSAVLVSGLTRLVEAQVASAVEMGFEAPGIPPRLVQTADCGWLTPAHRESWDQHYTRGQKFRQFAVYQRFTALQTALTTRGREQLVSDAEWYRSEEFNDFHRSMGIDDILASMVRTDDPPGLMGFTIFRALNQERFGAWERRVVRVLHQELSLHVGSALARVGQRPELDLPPRLRETLRCLLEGDSEKQAALRLGLSTLTVHLRQGPLPALSRLEPGRADGLLPPQLRVPVASGRRPGLRPRGQLTRTVIVVVTRRVSDGDRNAHCPSSSGVRTVAITRCQSASRPCRSAPKAALKRATVRSARGRVSGSGVRSRSRNVRNCAGCSRRR
jgi:hypothetical protein